MQRGVQGTAAILEQLLDGVCSASSKVLICDLLVNRLLGKFNCLVETLLSYIFDMWFFFLRFGEWSQAVWSKQKPLLNGASGMEWYFLGSIVQDEHDDQRDSFLARLPNAMSGQIMQDTVVILQICVHMALQLHWSLCIAK